MAVTVNGKIIRSLPEQVCENTKKIKEIEENNPDIKQLLGTNEE